MNVLSLPSAPKKSPVSKTTLSRGAATARLALIRTSLAPQTKTPNSTSPVMRSNPSNVDSFCSKSCSSQTRAVKPRPRKQSAIALATSRLGVDEPTKIWGLGTVAGPCEDMSNYYTANAYSNDGGGNHIAKPCATRPLNPAIIGLRSRAPRRWQRQTREKGKRHV